VGEAERVLGGMRESGDAVPDPLPIGAWGKDCTELNEFVRSRWTEPFVGPGEGEGVTEIAGESALIRLPPGDGALGAPGTGFVARPSPKFAANSFARSKSAIHASFASLDSNMIVSVSFFAMRSESEFPAPPRSVTTTCFPPKGGYMSRMSFCGSAICDFSFAPIRSHIRKRSVRSTMCARRVTISWPVAVGVK